MSRLPAPVVRRNAAWLCASLLAGVLISCGGGGGSNEAPPSISQAVSARDLIAEGAPGLTSTLEITLARGIDVPNDEVPLESSFEVRVPDPLDPEQTERVFPLTAEQSPDDRRIFTLRFDQLIPDGSELVVAARLFGAEEGGDLTSDVQGDVSPIQALLASSSLVPVQGAILEAGDFVAATDGDRDRALQRQVLQDHLEARGSSSEVASLALERFDTMPEEVIPHPKLRAALSALTGTFAEAAVDDLLTESNCTGRMASLITFQDPPDAPDLFARVTHETSGARIVSFSPRLEAEPLELLMPLMAHEATHCDEEGGVPEEVAATAFDTLLYIQLLTVNPELALHGSPLSKDLNVDAIAMLNSGRSLPESVGVLESPAVTFAVPNTNSQARSFADLVASVYAGVPASSPTEPLAAVYVQTFAQSLGLPQGDVYDFDYLDAVLGRALDPETLVYVIGVLGLEPQN